MADTTATKELKEYIATETGILVKKEEYDQLERLIRDSIYDNATGVIIEENEYSINGIRTKHTEYINNVISLVNTYDPITGLLMQQELYVGGVLDVTRLYRYSGTILQKVEVYSVAGELLREERYFNDVLTEIHYFTYTNSLLTQVDVFDVNNVQLRKVVYVYDSENELQETFEYFGTTTQLAIYTRYEDGIRVEERIYNATEIDQWVFYEDGSIIRTIDYEYDTTYQIAIIVVFGKLAQRDLNLLSEPKDANGIYGLETREIYYYNQQGLNTKTEIFDKAGVLLRTIKFRHNAFGRLEAQVVIEANGLISLVKEYNEGVQTSEILYAYDSNGIIISITKNLIPGNIIFEESIFNNGLLITFNTYTNGILSSIKEIEYQLVDDDFIISKSTIYTVVAGINTIDVIDFYDSKGRVKKREIYQGGIVIKTKTYNYWPDLQIEDQINIVMEEALTDYLNGYADSFILANDVTNGTTWADTMKQIWQEFVNGLSLCTPQTTYAQYVESILQYVRDTLGYTVDTFPGQDPELFFSDEISIVLSDGINNTFIDIIRCINEEIINRQVIPSDAEVFDLFETNGFTEYENWVVQANRDLQETLRAFKEPPAESIWQPAIFLRPKFFDTIQTVLEAFKNSFDAAMDLIRQTSTILENAVSLLAKKLDVLDRLVQKLIADIMQVVSSTTGGLGVSVMYIAPGRRTINELFDEFKNTFDAPGEARFRPSFAAGDAIGGIGWTFVTNDLSDLKDRFIRLGRLFHITAREFRVLIPFVIDVSFIPSSFERGTGFTQAKAVWNDYEFPYTASLRVLDPSEEKPVVDVVLSGTNSYTFPIDSGKDYSIAVTIHEIVNVNGEETTSHFVSGVARLQTPTRLTLVNDVLENTDFTNIKSIFTDLNEKPFMTGIIEDKHWFNATLDSFFPDVFAWKKLIIQIMTNIQNRVARGTSTSARATEKIAEIQRKFNAEMLKLTRRIDDIISLYQINIRDICYYKWIEAGIGGNTRYINEMVDTTGIPLEAMTSGVYTAGIYMAVGAPTLDQVLNTIENMKKFIILENPRERDAVNNLIADIKELENVDDQFIEAVEPLTLLGEG